MDLFSGLKSEIFRPLVTLVIPGVIASGPWWGVLFSWFPPIRNLFGAQPSAAWAIVLGTALASGLILENVGSRIETWWDYFLDKAPKGQHSETWHRYLRQKDTERVVASRYMRTILLRMKFELSMAPALFVAALGLWVWQARTNALGQNYIAFLTIVAAIGIYFLAESFSSARVMSSTRTDLIAALDSQQQRCE